MDGFYVNILFESKEACFAFLEHYKGNRMSYHPNYKGQPTFDRTVMGSKWWVKLERSKIVDFMRLRQDVDYFGGKLDI